MFGGRGECDILVVYNGRDAAERVLQRSGDQVLQKLNEALRNAKDRDEVRAIERQHSGVEDTFEALHVNVRGALRDLSQAEEEVLFATMAGRAWIPSGDVQTFRPEMIRAFATVGAPWTRTVVGRRIAMIR